MSIRNFTERAPLRPHDRNQPPAKHPVCEIASPLFRSKLVKFFSINVLAFYPRGAHQELAATSIRSVLKTIRFVCITEADAVCSQPATAWCRIIWAECVPLFGDLRT